LAKIGFEKRSVYKRYYEASATTLQNITKMADKKVSCFVRTQSSLNELAENYIHLTKTFRHARCGIAFDCNSWADISAENAFSLIRLSEKEK
jgi:hypothetical protein